MLNLIIICALFAYGMFTGQRQGFIFGGWPKLWKAILPKWLHEPFFDCGVCVSSVWGGLSWIYLALINLYAPDRYLFLYAMPVALVSMMGVCALLDRAVKAFEKHYDYKSPKPPLKGEARWGYLLPYQELRRVLVEQYVTQWTKEGCDIVEIGGYHKEWENMSTYNYFDHNRLFTRHHAEGFVSRKKSSIPYCVIIMGLAYAGDLRELRKLVQNAKYVLIEYSDDGISRQQIELLTERIKTKMLIPEFSINKQDDCPRECVEAGNRKIIILQP